MENLTMDELEEKTNIQIDKDIWIWLHNKKIHPRQPFNEVLREMMRQDTYDKH